MVNVKVLLCRQYGFWAANGPKLPRKNAKMICSLPETINYKKKHVGNNYAKNSMKLHEHMGIYYDV